MLKSVGFLFSQTMKYTKPPLTIFDQIKLLESRGLVISDKVKAEKYLANISYYRLSAYLYPFKNLATDEYAKVTTFENVLDLYLFDRELRLLIFDAIERIEIAFRTQLIYQPAMNGGAFWFRDAANSDDIARMNEHNYQLETEVARSSEVFVEHFKTKYTEEEIPPVWMSFEVLSLGLLSKFYQNLKFSSQAKKDIAKHFGLNESLILQSWIRSITYVRNICAHHSRLWNRTLTSRPKIIRKPSRLWITSPAPNNEKIYYFLCCLWYLLREINPETRFVEKLKALFVKYPNTPLKAMDFPENWEKEAFWQ
jgi:abortive infection bacteriophage resistance protein